MKLMVMHRHDVNSEAGKPPPPELVAKMGALIGGMAQTGKFLEGEGLGASRSRSRVTFNAGTRTLTHGPYAGRNELPASVAKIRVGSREEAIALATSMGEQIGGDLEIEVGQVNEPWDIGLGAKPPDAPLRFLLVHKATPATEAGRLPNLELATKEAKAKGALQSKLTLTPSSQGKRLLWEGGRRSVIDGPFTESKELIGGYSILQLPSVEETIAFCSDYAAILLPYSDRLEIDIRPVAE
jgi:hypothetical protein